MKVTRSWLTVTLIGAALLVPLSRRVQAQVAGGTIFGTVKDSSGAAMPSAKVTIRNSQTDVARTATVNSDGIYAVPNLLPGDYLVTVSAAGFKTVVRTGLTLAVGAELAVNIEMPVGAITEKVEVRGEAPAVDTSSATISAIVD